MAEVCIRSEVSEEDSWNLKEIYASDTQWEEAFEAAQLLPEKMSAWKGKLGESPEILAEALQAMFDAQRNIEKIYLYAHLCHDQDLGQGIYQDFYGRALKLYHQFGESVAYFDPEILRLESDTMQAWLKHPALQAFRIQLEDTLRRKPHTLSQAEERLMAMASEALGSTSQIFSMLNNLDIPDYFGKVTDEDQEEVQITHATFAKLMRSSNRDVRRNVFNGYFTEFGKHRKTLSATLDGKVKASLFQARARNYNSSREAALFDDNVSTDVYDGLIDTIHERLPDFIRYMKIRKRALGLEKMHAYDGSAPIVSEIDLKYTWEEAENVVCEALKPLGDAYVDQMREGLNNRWVDRYENKGKRSGAYSSGCYDSMPYILHNFNGTLNSVFTLAHELGHSMHTALTNEHQSYQTSHYKIFVAEVASTTNEALLVHHMLQQTNDPKTRAYLLNHQLSSFRGTMFRQTMFAEFERDIHAAAAEGKGLTTDFLDEHYYELSKTYFGDSLAWDEEDAAVAYEWCRIPHFYYNFYVYKYATGMAAATALSRSVLQEGEPAVQRLLNFLKAGSSRYPLELLQDAGVDLTTTTPVSSALDTFSELVGQLDELI